MDNIFLETERLYLRKITQSDFSELSLMLKNPKVMYAWEYAFSDNDIQDWIDKNIQKYQKHNLGYFLAIDKKTLSVVGQAALMPDIIKEKEYYEIGYILKDKYWGKGYAGEAARALSDYAFNVLNLCSVIFEIRPENISSRKVAEAIGAIQTGEFIKNVRGKDMLHMIYTLKN